VGRTAELRALERRYASARSELIPVYGRRRVGKTELLLRFAAGKPTVYFSASDRLRTTQIGDFLRAAAEWLGAAHLAGTGPLSWEVALKLVVAAAPPGRKLVLVLDEFQWLCRSSPELPSTLQRLWDLEWQRGTGLCVILCGSFIGFMEREVLGARSPLHGRRTASIRLEPFGFREASAFHPRWSVEEQARARFVCGGIPAYLRRFDPSRSVAQNIAREFFEVDAFFLREPEFLLREELAEVKQAASVLEAVALGRHGQSRIARAIGMTASALAPHLRNLVALGYMERVFPLSPRRPPRTSVVYRIADPLLRFYFRFVEPHLSALRRRSGARAFEQIVAPEWDSFCGEGFERLCREALPLLYDEEGVSQRFEVGEYWDRDVQIDVVGLRADGWVDLGECRWSAGAGLVTVARELAARAHRFPAGGRSVRHRLFVRRRPATVPQHVSVHDLASLHGDRE
jgi:AAA+ ATPase superfamily predicted ATPase